MTPISTRRRIARTTGAIVVLAAIGAGIAVAVHRSRSDDSAPPTTVAVLKTAAVTTGDVTTSIDLQASVELSHTTTVIHRIAGASASRTATSSGSASAAPAATSGSAPAATPAADCAPASTTPAAAPVPTLPADSTTTTVPETTVGTTPDTTTTTDIPTTTTIVSPTTAAVPAPTAPCVTTPGDTGSTTSTAPAGATGGSSGPRGGGGFGGASAGGSSAGGASAGGASSAAATTQRVTSVVAAGSTVGLGDILYTVDGRPVVALGGPLPAWRSLSTSSTDGPDIAQLEWSLAALGYDPDHTMTIDESFDSHTRQVVKAWQAGVGLDVTGTVTLGSVVFLDSGSVSVTTVDAAVGDSLGDGDPVVTLATDSQRVLVQVPAEDQQVMVPGLAVQIGDAPATVSELRSIQASDGSIGVEAVIVPSAPIAGATDGTVVRVKATTTSLTDVLLVPTQAVVSKIDGTYAVEVRDAAGADSWVTVVVVGTSGNKVGITGNGLAAGAQVLVPA